MDLNKYLEGLRQMKICRTAPVQPPQPGTQIKLDAVGSYNLEVDIGDRRGFSTYTLREVPIFLVDAFRLLRQHGMTVEGIFRKEGNVNRIKNVWPTYFGCKEIPEICNTHDICSMIKRFFREMRTPLFVSDQSPHLVSQLLQIECRYEGMERVNKLLEVVRELPPGHLGTLSFLMRQLKYFGDNCNKGHQMTVDNLALVFAPTLFRDDIPAITAGKKKKGSQENVISSVCNDNELKVAVLVDLIKNAHKVGVPRDYYIASRRPSDPSEKTRSHKMASSSRLAGVSPRSSSARPSPRQHAYVVNDDHPRSNALGKRTSARPEEESKVRMLRRGRRSSSTVREIFTTISNKVFLRRCASPGGHRRASDDAVDMNDAYSGLSPDPEKTPLANSTSVDGVSHVYVGDGDENEGAEGASGQKATPKPHQHERNEQVTGLTKILSFGNIEGDGDVRESSSSGSSSAAAAAMTATATTTCQEDDKAETSKALKGKEEPSGATEDGGDAVRLRHAKNVNGEQPSASRANASKESSVDRSHQHAHSSSRTGRETKKGSAAHTPSTSTSRHSHHHHQQMSDGTRRSALAACAVADSDEGMTTTHQRRSRRESPRKHLTVNSKVKPVAPSPVRNVANSNWMKVPPDEEPDNLLPTAIRRKESAEKSKVIANGKIVKRNSSKASSKCSNSSKSSPRFDDPANSLLDQYDGHTGRNTTERRRWHTTPIRPNALLRRNQPNTLATGLKATQVHIRDRRSTTSFGLTTEEHNKLRRSDKMKRGSSSALSCSDQSHVDSDEENSAASVLSPLADTTAILQQKGIESRERRAKRHKRREEGAKSSPKRSTDSSLLSTRESVAATKTTPSSQMVSTNLLDDVTNELERLEQMRGGAGERRAGGNMPKTGGVGTTSGNLTSLTLLANGYPVPSSMATASAKSPPSKTLTTSASSSSQISKTSSRLHADGTRQVTTTLSYRNSKTCASSQSVTATSSQSPAAAAATPITNVVGRSSEVSPIALQAAGVSSSSSSHKTAQAHHSESSQKLLKRRSTSNAQVSATGERNISRRSPSSKKPTSSTSLQSSKTAKSSNQSGNATKEKHRHSAAIVTSTNQSKENIPVLTSAGTSASAATVPSTDSASVAGMPMPLTRHTKSQAASSQYRTTTTTTTTTKSGSSSTDQMNNDSMRLYRRTRFDGMTKLSLDEKEFSHSEDIKKQILGAHTDKDIKYGPAHIPFDARPSVAYIKRNNRGIVQQRVSQFAQLGVVHATAGNEENLKEKHSPLVEFAKPTAPPVSHGLRKSEKRETLSPQASSVVSVSARAKKFEALSEAAAASCSPWNQHRKGGGASRKPSTALNNAAAAVGSKVSSRRVAGERRAIGERRESHVTRHLLSKSLGKLELLASGVVGGMGASNNANKTSAPALVHTQTAFGLDKSVSSTSSGSTGHAPPKRISLGCLTNISEYVRFVGGSTSKCANLQDSGTASANSSSISSGTFSTSMRKGTKLNRKRLKYVNRALTARTTNLHSIQQSQEDI